MKTEDIDKRIGMPDVEAEWARFEREVIGKEPKGNRRSIYSWIGGLGIAACILLFFLINMGDEPKPAAPVVAEQAEPLPIQQPATEEVKEEPIIVHIVNTRQPKKAPRKELALANADAPATTGLTTSCGEYTGEVQKFNMDDVKDLAFESVDQALQEQIAGLDIVPNPSYFDSDTTMRLRGKTDNNKRRQPLIVLNGQILEIPDSAKFENYDTEELFASLLGIKSEDIKSIYVLKDDKATAKWGEKGAAGVIAISTKQHQLADSVKRNINEEAKRRYLEWFDMANKNDTLSDNYMNQHEELKASRYRISGIVLNEDKEPLPHTMIDVVKEGNKIWGRETADSTGHFAFWAPRKGVKIRFSYVGFYKVVEIKPTDKPLTIRMKPTKGLKKLKKLSFE